MIAGLVGIALVGIATRWPKMCRYTIAHAREVVLALGVNMDREKFSLHDLKVGMNVEREHFDVTKCKPILSARIALAHLRERPDYYERLKKYVDGIGAIPPEPDRDSPQWEYWAQRTYQPGSVVKFTNITPRDCSWHYEAGDSRNQAAVSKKVGVRDGWRGTIVVRSGSEGILVQITDARDASGYQTDAVGKEVWVSPYCVQALTDNWGSSTSGQKRRYQLPASQKKRYKGRVSGLGTVPSPRRDWVPKPRYKGRS